jgi:hypothetical protein
MIHIHDLVNKSIVDCASSGNGLAVPDPMARPRIIPVKSTKKLSGATASSCQAEYDRITAGQTPGITSQDLRRSQAWTGNQHRLMQMMSALSSRQRPVVAVVAGGSISLGHGVTPEGARYANRFERWMNEMYPLQNDVHQHGVINVAAHGADMCAMAKRLNVLYSDLSSKLPPSSNGSPDLIILEFAVNDYQGQDHLVTVDSKKSVFFDGFRELVLCSEVVIHALLNKYPSTGLLFLEMQTAIATRKTGALLHMGVGKLERNVIVTFEILHPTLSLSYSSAQHYQIPVVSYAEVLFPDFFNLVHILQEMDKDSFTFPKDQLLLSGDLGSDLNNANISSAVLPYPHGCAPCQLESITPQFRPGGCKSVCTFMERSFHDMKLKCNAKQGHIPAGRFECFVPFLAPDAIHPSAVGHAIATDILVHTLASTRQNICHGMVAKKDFLPLTTFVADDFDQLNVRGDYLVVKDVARIFSRWDRLTPIPGSDEGFTRYADDELKQRPGWIATEPLGNSKITFSVELPPGTCYVVYVAILRSYKGMGTFRVEVRDFGDDIKKKQPPKKITTKDVDSLWDAPISVWSDERITEDSDPGCTGYCELSITTNPTVVGRNGNKVKVLTVSARRCTNARNP